MLLLKTKPTNRKFYGKWLYKTSIHIDGCSILRSKTLDELIEFLNAEEPKGFTFSTHKKAWQNRDSLLDLCECFKQINKDEYSLRIESSWMDIYTNDKNFYEMISVRFETVLRHRFEPSEATIELLNSNQNYISVDKLPKGRYNYRVYLLPHKMAGDKEGKEKFLTWLKSQTPKVTCTPAIEKWFISTDWNWDRRYILVEDEATLLMLKLRNAEVVGRIYNFVISDK